MQFAPVAAQAAATAAPTPPITVDLETQKIRGPDGGCIAFEMDPFRKRCLLEGLDNIGLTLESEKDIGEYEVKVQAARPWV